MWKVGSELQFTTSLPEDPVDSAAPAPCRKVVFRLRTTLMLSNIDDFCKKNTYLLENTVNNFQKQFVGGKNRRVSFDTST